MDLLQSKVYRKDLSEIASTIDLTSLNGKTILITGGLGLICSAIADLLIICEEAYHSNFNIIIAARNKNEFNEKYGHFPFVHYEEYDALKNINFTGKADYIIHGASIASPERYVSSPVETLETGIMGTDLLLKYGVSHNTKCFLFISSSEVYGVKEHEGSYSEEDYGVINLDTVRSSYSVSKRAAEMLCRSYSSEFLLNTMIVRPGHVFGPSASEKDNRISSAFAYKAARGEKLVLKSSGLQERSYIYAPDCAKAILTVMLNGSSGQSYNIGAEMGTTIKEMAECYAEAGGVELVFSNPASEEIKVFNPMNNATLNISKIKELGYRDVVSVHNGLIHTVKILREMINAGRM